MDSEYRVAKLREWLADKFEGSPSMFCRYYNLNYSMASFISQVMNGHRKFGERAARNLERSTGRPTGWFDVVESDEQIEVKSPISFDYSMVDALPKQERELIESFISWRLSMMSTPR